VRVLQKVAPVLVDHGVQFKAPSSLKYVMTLNAGLDGAYSQVGKIITVYPETPEEAVQLARRLHKLTLRMAAPEVPFDLRYSPSSNVYYRFGAFLPLEIEHANGSRTLAVRGPNGELVPDRREKAEPDWVTNPFTGRHRRGAAVRPQKSLVTSYAVFRALAQRGKGGVYQAVDLTLKLPRLCLIKEGRKHGELNWDGRDGRWRIRNEEHVLSELMSHGVNVPRVYSSFESEGNAYLVMEFIDGETLQSLLSRLRRRMPISRVLEYGIQLAGFISGMHAAGWVWRDCKPMNIIITRSGSLQPFDFEGASRIDRPDPMLWGTPGFIPPEWKAAEKQTGRADDLYALGAMLYLLATGRLPSATDPIAAEKQRRNIPGELCKLILRLLNPDPRRRPSAKTTLAHLHRTRGRLHSLTSSHTSEACEPHRLSSAAVAADWPSYKGL
jgi:serine/threonine protein kinase